LIAATFSLKVSVMKEATSKTEKYLSNSQRAKGGPGDHDDLFAAANNPESKKNIGKDLSATFNNMKEEEKSLIDCLFERPEKTNCDCEGKVGITARVIGPETKTIIVGGITILIPIPKPYPFEGIIEFGFGDSGYIFDYMDSVFQFDIVYHFLEIYWQMYTFKFENESDPYWEEYLSGRKTVFQRKIQEETKAVKIDFTIKLDKEQKAFAIPDRKLYDISIALPQFEYYFKQWSWNYQGKSDVDSAKHFLNNYDFNGDGRLSPRELLFGLIMENMDNDVCKFCLNDIRLKFDVMFKYMKCYEENHILVTQMAKKLRLFKRQSKQEYYLYNCHNESLINKFVTDFFSKTTKLEKLTIRADNQLRLDNMRFRMGLFLGFWNRQVSDTQIYASEEILARYEQEYSVKIEKREAFILDLDARTQKIERWGPTKNMMKDCPPPKIQEKPKDCYE